MLPSDTKMQRRFSILQGSFELHSIKEEEKQAKPKNPIS